MWYEQWVYFRLLTPIAGIWLVPGVGSFQDFVRHVGCHPGIHAQNINTGICTYIVQCVRSRQIIHICNTLTGNRETHKLLQIIYIYIIIYSPSLCKYLVFTQLENIFWIFWELEYLLYQGSNRLLEYLLYQGSNRLTLTSKGGSNKQRTSSLHFVPAAMQRLKVRMFL